LTQLDDREIWALLVLVVAETRLQEAITGPARATVTSVAGVGVELAAPVVFAAYTAGGRALIAGAVLLLRRRAPPAHPDAVPPGVSPTSPRGQLSGLRGSIVLLMIRFWISLVPSKIVVSRASRQCRSTWRSVV
jgi:hypothetical protein